MHSTKSLLGMIKTEAAEGGDTIACRDYAPLADLLEHEDQLRQMRRENNAQGENESVEYEFADEHERALDRVLDDAFDLARREVAHMRP